MKQVPNDTAIEADPELTAREIRKTFAEFKTEQTGRPYRPAKKYNRPEFWQVAAENCIRLGADPRAFVRALFVCTTTPGGPFPNQITGNYAVNCYHQYLKWNAVDPADKTSYEQQIHRLIRSCFVRAIAQKRTRVRDFLLDDNIRTDTIPAFVRIILMPKDQQILERWGAEAYQELKPNTRLLRILHEAKWDVGFLEKIENR